jgi:phosphohistidine phosphatase
MKKLYLIRHGQAESKRVHPDIDRNLDDEGRDEVARTAHEMVKKNIKPSLIISSYANRALQTATIVAETIGYKPADIALESDIYYTDVQTLFEILHRQEDKYESILLAGHNPSISQLAGILSGEYNDLMPTGGLVAFETDSDTWNHFEKKNVSLLLRFHP